MRCLISANISVHYPMFAMDVYCIFAEGVRNIISSVCCILPPCYPVLPGDLLSVISQLSLPSISLTITCPAQHTGVGGGLN